MMLLSSTVLTRWGLRVKVCKISREAVDFERRIALDSALCFS